MIRSLSAFFYRIASWKTLLLGILLFIPFPTYILRSLEERMNALAGQPLGPIDLLIGYNPVRIERMIAAYGAEGRAIYARGELTTDLIYPIIYSLLFCVILSLLFRNRPNALFRRVNLLPLVILLLDLLENACIVYLLGHYPSTSITVASLCSLITNVKWAVSAIVVGLTLYGLVRLALNWNQTLEQV